MNSQSLFTRLLHRIVAHPSVFNLLQRVAGMEESRRRLRRVLGQTSGILLDVGGGTGNYVDLLPASTSYIWLDNDVEKLRGFRSAHPAAIAVLGDASRIPIREQGVDYVMSVAVSHHLTDAELESFLGSLVGICRRGFVFLDALDRPDSLVSRLLWRYDRGRHPRKIADLRRFLERHFEIQAEEQYSVYHSYFLCLAVPKRSAP